MKKQCREFFLDLTQSQIKKLEKVKDKIKYIGFLFISKGGSTNSYVGCAFKGLKKFNKGPKEVRKRYKEIEQRLSSNVLKHGIDYEYFLEEKKKKKKKNKAKLIEPLRTRSKQQRKRNVNKFMVQKFSTPREYNRRKILKIKESVKRDSERRYIVNQKKEELYEGKMKALRNRKSRNQICKEKKFERITNNLQGMKKKCDQLIWVKFIKTILLIDKFKTGIAVYRYKVEKRKKMERVSFIMFKFIRPMKKAKKSKMEGDIMRVKQ